MSLFEGFLSFLSIVLGLTSAYYALEHRRDRRRVAERSPDWNLCFVVAEDLHRRISRWNPDLVIGLGRSGGIWGGWMAGNLGSKPFSVVDDRYRGVDVDFPGGLGVLEAMKAAHPSARKVLVIMGASSRGETFRKFRTQFAEVLQGWDVRYSVLFVSTVANGELDFVGRIGPEQWPEKLPWHRHKGWITSMRRDAA